MNYDAILFVSFGGPESQEDVIPFLENVLRGRNVPRERMLAVERGPHLKLIESVKGPFDTWYLMNARIVHSVENMTGVRVNLQVSFDTELPQTFVSRFLS